MGSDKVEDTDAGFARSVQIVSPLPDFLGPTFPYFELALEGLQLWPASRSASADRNKALADWRMT